MQKIAATLLLAAGLLAAAPNLHAQENQGKRYGQEFTVESPKPAAQLSKMMGKKKKLENVQLTGKIVQVCQAEGCWMKLENGSGQPIMVKFSDHAFLIPKDMAGNTATVIGTAEKKVVSVKEQRHLLEDAGASAEAIAAITEPKEELRVEATGIIIH